MNARKPKRAERARRSRGPLSPDIDSREQLLIAVGEIMTERGSTDVSLNDVGQKSGLNTALIAYYFGSKSGLMVALLRKVLGPAMVQLAHLAEMNVPPQDKLRIHISGIVKTYFRYPYVNRLMHQLLAEDAETFGPLIAEEFGKPLAEGQRRILEEGVEMGVFRPIDPLLFYFHVTGACDQLFYGRYQLEHVFGIKSVTDSLRREFVDHIHGIILEGIVRRPDEAA